MNKHDRTNRKAVRVTVNGLATELTIIKSGVTGLGNQVSRSYIVTTSDGTQIAYFKDSGSFVSVFDVRRWAGSMRLPSKAASYVRLSLEAAFEHFQAVHLSKHFQPINNKLVVVS